mmetsp:Transcript_15946/g.20240  ORF Transcript_15946/g.20240 Transcript_15946/m.20240 type:complete len:217 (-) Transcript_15946:142-792(-)
MCGDSNRILCTALIILAILALLGAGLGSAGLGLSLFSPQVTISDTCGVGTFKCYGEGVAGGDFSGANMFSVGGDQNIREETNIVSLVPDSLQGFISVNVTAPNPDIPSGLFQELELCSPDPLNGLFRQVPTRYSCASTIRNDESEPSVMIDVVYNSCNELTKIIRNVGSNPGVFWVNCVKEMTEEEGGEGEGEAGEEEKSIFEKAKEKITDELLSG